LKGNNSGSNKNGKSHNKSWENEAKDDTDNLQKELAALAKKVTQSIKKQKLNKIDLKKKVEPMKKHKIKSPAKKMKSKKSRCSALLMPS